jgi:hypothetical protein
MQSKALFGLPTDDCAVTARYWETMIRREHLAPEAELMRAVLKSAIRDYRRYLHKKDRRFRDAQRWLFERDADHVFSFENIRESLELNPQRIRGRLLEPAETRDANNPSRAPAVKQLSNPPEKYHSSAERISAQ